MTPSPANLGSLFRPPPHDYGTTTQRWPPRPLPLPLTLMMMTLWFMSMECVAAQAAAREAPVSARGGPPEPPGGPYVYDTVKLLRAKGGGQGRFMPGGTEYA